MSIEASRFINLSDLIIDRREKTKRLVNESVNPLSIIHDKKMALQSSSFNDSTSALSKKLPTNLETPESSSVSFSRLIDQVEKLSKATQHMNRSLEFTFDDEINKTVITIRDKETDEIIRKIPAEELVEISKRIQENSSQYESSVGLLFSSSA